MKNISDTWEFVEKYYPKYYSCDEIAENDDLTKIIDGEINGQAEVIYNEIKESLKEIFGTEPEESQIINVAEQKLNESNAYIFEKAIEGYIESLKSVDYQVSAAKETLQENGYYSGNLWTIHDVKHKFKCSDKQALEVLEGVFTNGATIEEINNTISLYARENGLPEYKENLIYISGFYKDDKTKFSDFLVYAYGCAPEDEDINDEDIFFYGLSEEQIISAIKYPENSTLDFVITSYEKATI